MRRRNSFIKVLPDAAMILGLVGGVFLMMRPEWFGVEVVAGLPGVSHSDVLNPPAGLFPIIFLTIMWAALRASAHAEAIAVKLAEPFGTLVLTVSAVVIEVAMILGVILSGSGGDTVARDTLFATLMLIMNGLVGASLILAALRKREQRFNKQSSSAFLGLIAAMCVIGLILPRFTVSEPGGDMSDGMEIFVTGALIGVYGAFVALQSSTHRDFFTFVEDDASPAVPHAYAGGSPLWRSVLLLVCSLLTVILLAESLGGMLVTMLDKRSLPHSLQGLVIAFLVLLPEGIAAVRSAMRSDVQRTVNILHGSALSTIGLTIPAVLVAAYFFGRKMEMGLEPAEICLLVATIFLSFVHFGQGKTNMMQGIVHMMFFALWIALLLEYDLPVAAQ